MRRTVVSALLCWAIASPATAADFYVKNGGNDGGNGLTIATAWASLQHAADVVNPGDTVHVLDGSYQGFDLRRSGAPGNPITFVADGSNVSITDDNPVTPDGINVEEAAHIVIDGFIADDRTRAGIRVAVSQFVTVRNCRTGHNGRWGIFSGFADDFTIEDNETHHSVAEHGIYVSNSGDRPIIRRNLVHDNHANGIHMNGDSSQGGDGTISDALVERNIIFGNGAGGGSGINMDGVSASVVRNNLLYDNHASGISLYRIDGATGAKNNLVVNNTIINAADSRWCINISNGSTGNRVRNNILYNFHDWHGVITIDNSSRTGFVSDYNSLMDRFTLNDGTTVLDFGDWQALGYDAHSFLATPADHFVVPGSDFRLLSTSPAIDSGTSSEAPSIDLDGNPRPVGAGFDIGAYESISLTCNDGTADPGEQCGEPSLPACADPCTSCLQCACIPTTPVCGDANVCGAEECENDADCSAGQSCSGCQCINPSICASGIAIEKPRLKARSNEFTLRLKGEAVIAKPWIAIDPSANGIRIVIDSPTGSGGVDVVIPGGALWSRNSSGTRWTYRDASGSVAGITRAVVRDRSNVEDGRIGWLLKGRGGSIVLPDVGSVRTAVVLGAPGECAAIDWGPPGGTKPRCEGDSASIRCN